MENRLSLPEMVEDEFRRFSFTPSVMPQRGSVAILHPRRDLSPEPENVVDTPPPESPTFEPENVFATPTHSRSNSLSASMATMEYDGLSLRRSSLTLSEPRSLSPLPVADGGWGSYGGHRRSISLSRSVTPSMSVGTLRRSDTTNTQTTNASSTLYYSRTSGTPSSLQSVAVRPRFDYGGHQQTLSINGSELDDADPFDDGYVVPVSDGFAPRTQNLAPEAPGPSNAGTFGSLPPPYERYPEIAIGPTKGGEGEIDLGVREPDAFLPLAAAAIQLGDEGVRQRRDNGGAAGAVVVVAPIAGQDSGELKEWKGKKLATVRRWHIVLSGIVALLIGLAVGLGVGLGIGLNKGKELELNRPTTSYSVTTNYDASPEATTAPKSDTDYKYPSIPLGSHVISPIKLNSFSDGCLVSATSVFPPKYFALDSVGLWSCNIPELEPLLWDVDIWPVDLHDAELSQLGSVPDTLVCGKWEDSRWGSYLISSREGEYKEEKKNTVYVSVGGEKVIYNKPDGFREGLQGLAFYNQPLAYLNSTKSNPPNSKRAVVNSLDSYKFGVLYNKTVILRESTMQKTWKTGGSYPFKNGNGTELLIGEKVWMCVWEKTMLEVEIMINQTSTAYNQKNTSVNHAADHSGDDGYDTDNDDPESTMTTITVGLPDATSTPTTVKLTEEFEFVVTDTENSEDEEEIDFKSILNLSKRHFKHRNLLNPRYPSHGKVKRGRTVQEYTRKVYVTEYRPTPEQIRLALGIDKTDPPAMLAQLVPGPISCRKMIVQGDRGLREFNSDTEVISVDLREDVDAFLGLEKRSFVGSPDDTGCRCSWES